MRLAILAALGRLFGIQFNVDGLPYGRRPPPTSPTSGSRS